MNQRIYNYCIHLLSRQDYSEFKLRQKLCSKKDNLHHEIDEVINTLKSRNLLKEENYKRLFIRKWMMKGESKEKIRQRGSIEKLQFESEEFALVEKELGLSAEENIEKLISKKLRSKEIPHDQEKKIALRNKLLRFLLSKGHQYDECKRALNQFL